MRVALFASVESKRGLFVCRAIKTSVYPLPGPIGRFQRSRHRRFDRRAKVATSGIVMLAELGLSPKTSVRYEPTPVGFFRALLAKLSAEIDYPRTTFVDLGAGKGRVLLLASGFPFRKIIGVEISSELVETARGNVRSFHSRARKCEDIRLVCESIDSYEFDVADSLLIYLFNPCSEPILAMSLNKLAGLARTGSDITIIYLMGRMQVFYGPNLGFARSTTGRPSTKTRERSCRMQFFERGIEPEQHIVLRLLDYDEHL